MASKAFASGTVSAGFFFSSFTCACTGFTTDEEDATAAGFGAPVAAPEEGGAVDSLLTAEESFEASAVGFVVAGAVMPAATGATDEVGFATVSVGLATCTDEAA